ncbi:MAG: DUF6588 family protein [Gemmatimonadota bacterium]
MNFRSSFGALSAIALLLAVPPAGASAQEVEADLATIGPANAERYVRPLTRGIALAMGAGAFDGASVLGGLAFDVGVRVSGALPPPEAEGYRAVLPESVTWETGTGEESFQSPYRPQAGDGTTPTIAGRGAGVVLEPNGDFRAALIASGQAPSAYEMRLPDGRETPVVPYPVLHASLGIGLATEVSLRYLPALEVDAEIGGLRGVGGGVRHMVTRWFDSPVDVSVTFARQNLEVGEYVAAESTQYGVMAGRDLGPLSIFAMGVLREGTVDVRYESDNPGNENPALPPDGTEVHFSEEVPSGTAFGIGARLQLLVLNIAGHYTFDDYRLITLKVGFGFD